VLGEMKGVKVAVLARHGVGHRLLPGEVPSRANVFALKSLGVRRIISVNAVGSLREEIAPRHLAVPDQLIDRTASRPRTFFGRGLVAHVAFAEPFCRYLSLVVAESARDVGAMVHEGGTWWD
jgi:5'-methylthioadenosine phosphorylase